MPIAAILPFFSTLVGGIAALRLRHRLHPFMAFASGVLVATAIATILPEAQALVGPDRVLEVGVAAMAGYLLFTLIESFVHQTSFEHQEPAHDRERVASATVAPPRTKLAVLPPISLILHSTLDGLAIGLGFQASADIGVIVLVAVLAHDFADGMNVVALALDAASGAKLAIALLVLDALAPLLGVGLSTVLSVSPVVLGLLLAWFAGVFIAIGATHLLPESQHHRPADGPLLVGVSALGAAVVLVVRLLAGS
ncbi:MAG: ZIP family metal transporter [Chloroflexi bacterium]|nr:ZIP family metal transporter [Chloroflexota bacterium]